MEKAVLSFDKVFVEHILWKRYSVIGENGQVYKVTIQGFPRCNCEHFKTISENFETRRTWCEHINFIFTEILKGDNKFVNNKIPASALLEIFNDNQPLTDENWLNIVKKNGFLIRHMVNPTTEICLEAIKQAPRALKYIKNQTDEICMLAVKSHLPDTIEYVINQTPEICKEAIKNSPKAIRYIKIQTPELCMLAVKRDGLVLRFIKDQTMDICKEAIKQNIKSANCVRQTQVSLAELFRVDNVVFEDVVHNKFTNIPKEKDLLSTIYKYVELVFGTGIKENTEKIYNSKLTIDGILKDNKISGIHIVKINDNLFEIYNKVITKVNNGWVRNTYAETVKNEKIGRMFLPV